MFTGLIAALGTVDSVDSTEDGVRVVVGTELAAQIASGDSVAVNGVCLTATSTASDRFGADVMNQTLSASSLGELVPGSRVNIELPLRSADRLGGHVVQGHVDGVGRVSAMREDGFARVVTIDAEPGLLRHVAAKGSIAVDGVSLTVCELDEDSFAVSLIPETLDRTNLRAAVPGATVNLETDVLAKYVERLVSTAR